MSRVGPTRSWPKCEREVGASSNWRRSSAPVEGAPRGRRRREARGGGGVIAKVTRGQRALGRGALLVRPWEVQRARGPPCGSAPRRRSGWRRACGRPSPNWRSWRRLWTSLPCCSARRSPAAPAGTCRSPPRPGRTASCRTQSGPRWRKEAMSRLGFEASGHQAACRWVAVRHGRSSAGNDHVHVVVDLVREDGKVASTGNDFKRLSALCADMERRYGLSAVEGRANKDGDARAHPGRGGEGTPHRTGRSGTGRARPGGARCGYRRRQRSRVRAVPPGRRAGGQAPLRPRRRASRGRLRGGRGALRRRGGGLLRWGEAGEGPLAPGPTGPLARRRGREPGGRRRVGWRSPGDGRARGPSGQPAPHLPLGRGLSSVGARRRSGKSTGRQPSGPRPGGEKRRKAWAKWCASWAPSPPRT